MLQSATNDPGVTVHPAITMFERMLGYQNTILIHKMMSSGRTKTEALLLFEDVKKFLALAATTCGQGLSPTKKLDAGWHEFILFTSDYAEFCKNFCGRFIHHQPVDPFGKKDFESIPRTNELAKNVFGELSENWITAPGLQSSGCIPQGCQEKDCSPNDCTANDCKGSNCSAN